MMAAMLNNYNPHRIIAILTPTHQRHRRFSAYLGGVDHGNEPEELEVLHGEVEVFWTGDVELRL